MDTSTRVILFALIVLLLLIHPYGSSQSLNAGVTIGTSESCQAGYEYKGDVGFFAYCE